MVSVKELVAEGLVSAAKTVRPKVVEILVGEEIDRRVKAVVKGVKDYNDAVKAGNKLKPDVIEYSREGRVEKESYTKGQAEAVRKNAELVEKINAALQDALDEENPKFDRLFKLTERQAESGE